MYNADPRDCCKRLQTSTHRLGLCDHRLDSTSGESSGQATFVLIITPSLDAGFQVFWVYLCVFVANFTCSPVSAIKPKCILPIAHFWCSSALTSALQQLFVLPRHVGPVTTTRDCFVAAAVTKGFAC